MGRKIGRRERCDGVMMMMMMMMMLGSFFLKVSKTRIDLVASVV